MRNLLSVAILVVLSASSLADVKTARWTYQEDKNSEFSHVLQLVNQKTGLNLQAQDFALVEKRPLATSQFLMFSQQAGGYPVHGKTIRIWTRLDNQETIQVEAHVEEQPSDRIIRTWSLSKPSLDSQGTLQLIKQAIRKAGDDTEIKDFRWKDEWRDNQLIRSAKVKARRGYYEVLISLSNQKIVKTQYRPFLKSDEARYVSVPARVYPIWEEYENVPADLGSRVDSELKYLRAQVRKAGSSPYQALRDEMRYPDHLFDPIKGLTEEGRKQGFWAMSYVKGRAREIYQNLPLIENSFETGAILEGKFATVSLHPSIEKLQGIEFPLNRSSQFRPNWILTDAATEAMEMVPDSGILGRPLFSSQDALGRKAQRLADHSVVTYINDGFDEVQVYWAITQLFDSLRPMGFTDPELSTRPFHAYLYDTDISMRDNAYYTDDTINFTTYSNETHNMARDNSTIWHELGHGVMDRLMGDQLVLADTGGLSEGIADFVADLVIKEVMQGKDFKGSEQLRILNRTGFNLTNESHDDGEAYGGALHDVLESAMKRDGLLGLKKVTDLTLEAMRLTRNHPALTANEWFSHLLFADERGNPGVRESGELKSLIVEALQGRNFSLENESVASFALLNGAQEVTSTGPGSRSLPISVKMEAQETKEFPLQVKLQSGAQYQFQYPVTIKVQLQKGPIQGAIRWKNESEKPLEYVLRSEEDTAYLPLAISGTCDEVNRPDGSCVDYAYVQIWNRGETEEPQAKKRFYLRVVPQKSASTP